MTEQEAAQLQPGTLICVRECMLIEQLEDPGNATSLREVVDKHGYIYKFTDYRDNEIFPIQADSLATGKDMEFYLAEVEPVEGDDA